jgi:DNA-binding transcriptional regulator GbsR (MarR family)
VDLTRQLQEFVLRWGELASHWGLNRTEAQIHALLFISPDPLTAEEIGETLNVVRSNVSASVRELIGWGIVSRHFVAGDRRARYSAEKDVWKMLRAVVNEQKRREVEPFVGLIKRTLAERPYGGPPRETHAYEQIERMEEFLDAFLDWFAFIKALPLGSVRSYLRLGRKIRALLGQESHDQGQAHVPGAHEPPPVKGIP